MPIFGANPGMNQGLPVDKVKTMRAQGLDNNQIIQTLQRDGFSSSDIFDALNQADMANEGNFDSGAPYPQMENNMGKDDGFSSQGVPPPSNSGMMQPPGNSSYDGDVSTEELVEAIIDEKWNDLMKDISKVIEWKNDMTGKITLLDQRFNDLKSEFDKLHNAILGKIDNYDKNITNVGAEVKAMEKVFSKVLPVFTENVSELSKLAREFKKGAPSSSKKK
ncbi:hypothetical protein K9L67_00565 [Candidatus Woesearchaeota archaeon]|nr:hypothetical protein [Candidatus Woesearchaeota archaeon]MCF7900699.1 hypothetical protein [Candidatus Woesearchaeota archaeon]MCF8013220.1 hypothetical protein [Candidatus Woesearchaeota archaeon]